MTRILVADDSETVLLMLQRRLEMGGYEVLTATDGQEVLDEIGACEDVPDLILLDAMMPRVSGEDATRIASGTLIGPSGSFFRHCRRMRTLWRISSMRTRYRS